MNRIGSLLLAMWSVGLGFYGGICYWFYNWHVIHFVLGIVLFFFAGFFFMDWIKRRKK